MRNTIAFVLFALLVILPASPAFADSFKDVYKALKKVEMQLEAGTDRKSFRDSLVDAKTEMEFLPNESKSKKCIPHLKRALYAFEILNEIWQAQQYDSTIGSSYACLPVGSYESWLKSFPALLEWKWGKTGVGVEPTEKAKSASYNCCIILKSLFELAWAPCLLNEVRTDMNLAKKCFVDSKK